MSKKRKYIADLHRYDKMKYRRPFNNFLFKSL